MTSPVLPFHTTPAPAPRPNRSRPLTDYVLTAPPGGVSHLHEAANLFNSLGAAVSLVSNIPQLSPVEGSHMNAGGTLASAVTSIGTLAALCMHREVRKHPAYATTHALNALATSAKAGLDFAAAAGVSHAQTETARAAISALSAVLQPVIWGTKPSETKALGNEYRETRSQNTVPLEAITIHGGSPPSPSRSPSPASTSASYTTADTDRYWTPHQSSSPVRETPHSAYARGYEQHQVPQLSDTGTSTSCAPAHGGPLGAMPRANRAPASGGR